MLPADTNVTVAGAPITTAPAAEKRKRGAGAR
jgi:hypothetical protein